MKLIKKPTFRKLASLAVLLGSMAAKGVQAQDAAPQPDPYHLIPTTQPLVIRSFIEDSPARSIAVGFPQGVHYCLNGNSGQLEYIWIGGFLDVGPDRGRGKGRGGKPNKILGQRKDLDLPGVPVRFYPAATDQAPQFKGYRKTQKAPEIMINLQGSQCTQTIRPALGGIGVTIKYQFETLPSGAMQIYAPKTGWKTTSSLKLPDGKGWLAVEKQKEFEVTYLAE